jgi:hypothetical protein
VLEADETSRYLVIRTTVTNHSDRPESSTLVASSFAGDHTGILPWEDTDNQLRMFGRDDSVELPQGEFINPEVTYRLALVLRQSPDTDLDALTLSVRSYTFQEVDPQTLDPERWVLDEPLAEGHVPIEVAP